MVRGLNEEEHTLSQAEQKEIEDRQSCFLACNARATNNYADRHTLAYIANLYVNPFVRSYFDLKNKQDGTNIHVDEDLYALSSMLQWIWRSGIRRGEPISIYIPSTRMRTLFLNWLDGDIHKIFPIKCQTQDIVA